MSSDAAAVRQQPFHCGDIHRGVDAGAFRALVEDAEDWQRPGVADAGGEIPLAGDGKYGSRIKCPVALMCAGITYKISASGETKTVRIEPEDAFPWKLFAK